MREPAEISFQVPRPGRALKAVLASLAIFALVHAIVIYWFRSVTGAEIYERLTFDISDLSHVYLRPWTFLTSGFFTFNLWHLLWSLLGLYFLGHDLEKRWGGWGFVRFLAFSVILGNLLVLGASFIPHPVFHQAFVAGPSAALTAAATAWGRENKNRQMRFMFFIPMTGRLFFWITVAIAVLVVVFAESIPEGRVALLGGVASGVLFSGQPSPARALFLRMKLAFLRRKGGPSLTVESITGEPSRPRTKQRSGKAPPLRVVYGGLEDDLKNRKPPKDKRFLN